jgi:GNAT superfamily N-acetyltransferase
VQIREIRSGDVEAVAGLHARSWRTAYRGILDDKYLDGPIVSERREFWRERLARPNADHIGLVAVDDHTAVGFAFALCDYDPVWGTLLDNLHVAPERRGGAIGTKLLYALTERAAERSTNGIHLWVFEGNVRTRRYSERLGAEVIERQEAPAPGGGLVAEWLYAWPAIGTLRSAVAPNLSSGARQ